jgi:lipopolysaccharide export system permease protein
MLKIWEKYILRLFLSTLLFVLFGLFGLYVLIDYSCHTSYIHSGITSPFTHLGIIYLSEFVNRLSVLLPFAILIATIKTLTQLNIHNELVALLAGGLSIKRLLRPLYIAGILLTLILYVNIQVAIPRAKTTLNTITEERRQHKNKNDQPFVQSLLLEDESKVIFQKYDAFNKRFFDAYWILDTSNIYHIKHLYPYETPPRGEGVEQFSKDQKGALAQQATYTELTFNTMQFNKKRLWETTTLPDELSLKQLWSRIPSLTSAKNEKQSAILTTFYFKMVMPWLCLLAIIGPAPFCVRYTRTLPVFLLYACFTFIFVSFHLVMESAEVLGKRQVADPLMIIMLPFIIFSFPAFWYYHRQ